jgi:hypothetical protein
MQLQKKHILIIIFFLIGIILPTENSLFISLKSLSSISAFFLFISSFYEKKIPPPEREELEKKPELPTLEKELEISRYKNILTTIQSIFKNSGSTFIEYDPKKKNWRCAVGISPDGKFTTEPFFNDNILLEKIFEKKESFLLEDISDQSELAYYYAINTPRYETFVVPFFQNKYLVGFFSFDAIEKTFNEEEQQIIISICKTFEEAQQNPNLTIDENRLSIIRNDLYKNLIFEINDHTFYKKLAAILGKHFEVNTVYLVKDLGNNEGKIVHIKGLPEGISLNDHFPLNAGTVGAALNTNKFFIMDNLSDNIRFDPGEGVPEFAQSLMFMPITAENKLGIVLESHIKNFFTIEQKRIFKGLKLTITEIFRSIEKYKLINYQSLYYGESNFFSLNSLRNAFLPFYFKLTERHGLITKLYITYIGNILLRKTEARENVYDFIANGIRSKLRKYDGVFKYKPNVFLFTLTQFENSPKENIIKYKNSKKEFDFETFFEKKIIPLYNNMKLSAIGETIHPHIYFREINLKNSFKSDEIIYKIQFKIREMEEQEKKDINLR